MVDEGTGPREPGFAPVDPYALARAEAAALRIKRFYAGVSVAPRAEGGGFSVLLDGRPARTPKRAPIVFPTAAAADLVAAEFAAQGAVMTPGDMSVLRLVNAVVDGVSQSGKAVSEEIVRYASSDLLLYRADSPDELVALQDAAWDPVLAWARDRLGARFYLAQGIIHVAQPDHAVSAVEHAVRTLPGAEPGRAFRLGALHLMTTLTGSALLALAVLAGDLSAEEAWSKAHVDEDFQISRWGADDEAEQRRARRWADMRAAAALIAAVSDPADAASTHANQ